ncbi:caspase family protein [uncultured Hyphomonas sp.]|uniref:caspase family protein n=1 Tax=uncultured Hyphomonas sp. TaxID=225298 RepID=UPI002AAAEB16|nr:caspase family protein [uncultured Hyphomonas sp.]
MANRIKHFWRSFLARAALACACLLLLPATSLAETRLGLVISQTDYAGDLSRVASASQEADTIAGALIETGFDVTRAHDLNKRDLAATLNAFRRKVDMAGPDAVAFVYYTGHGAQHPESGDSYLLGVDAELVAASDLAFYGLDMQTQRDGFAATGARAVFLVFDACRNVPGFSGYKAGVKGLSRVEARPDMLIAYATGLDDVAKEGVYAPVLAEEIRRPGQKAEDAFAAAQRRVAGRTNRSQLPWTNNLLYNEFCFAACEKPAVTERPEPFELEMSGSELDQAFLAVYGDTRKATVDIKAEEDFGGHMETFTFEPAFAVKFDDYVALVSKGTNKEDAHVAAGRISAHYIKDGEVIGTWQDLAFGNGFGMPPDYSLRTGLLNYPTMMVKAGWTGQGFTVGKEDIIEITPDGPAFRASVTTLEDTTGAAYDEMKPCVLEGKIKPSRTNANSFQVDYKFTSDIKGEDRLVTYTLDPASGAYVPDFEIEPEICVTLMFDALEGDSN